MLASIGAFTLVAPSEADGRPVTLDLRDVSVAEAVRAVLDAAQLDGVFDPAGTLRVVIRSARVGRSE